MSDPFLRDALGVPCAMTRQCSMPWAAEARLILDMYIATLPPEDVRSSVALLRRRTEDAARSQQYPTVTETTLRAQIAFQARQAIEGATRR